MAIIPRRKTVTAGVGGVRVGSDAPIVVQSMTNTDTADILATVQQSVPRSAQAGSATHHPPFRPDQDASSLNRFPTQWLVSRNSHRHRSIRFGGSRDEELNRMRVGERALFGAAPEVGKDDDAGHSGISAP
jgi:hypothetical protein